MSEWRAHIKKVMKENPEMLLKDVLKLASKTYKRTKDTLSKAVKASKKSTMRTVKKTRNVLGIKNKSRKNRKTKGKKPKGKKSRGKKSRGKK